MHNLDINLLKDRYLESKSQAPRKKVMAAAPSWEKQVPLLIGGGVMLLLPLLAVLGTWFINLQAGKTQEKIQLLDKEISRLNVKNRSLKEMQAEITQINQGTKTLVSVFNYIKPWSAILSDIQSRTPPRVQITSIQEQKVGETSSKSKTKQAPSSSKTEQAPAELPPISLKVQGYARTYQEVNDFLLALQGSKFLVAEATAIESAKLVDLPIKWQGLEGKDASKTVKFPQVVEYSIATQLTQLPASQLMGELKSQGAVGLVTRLRTLQQKGAIQP
jgi:type IV pilus assembly protein PilN